MCKESRSYLHDAPAARLAAAPLLNQPRRSQSRKRVLLMAPFWGVHLRELCVDPVGVFLIAAVQQNENNHGDEK